MVQFDVLVATAATVGCFHTLLGPDHYIPFIAMARANRWSLRHMLTVTAACGLAHVGSSILIGCAGVALGTWIMRLEALEAMRGEVAAWLLIGFGLAYLTWGVLYGLRRAHHHHHAQAEDAHGRERHAHEHGQTRWTPWCLFLIFAFGPCEALIPLMMVPAAQSRWLVIAGVATAFMCATVLTMLAVVWVGSTSMKWLKLPDAHRFGHAMSGLVVLICGLSVKFGL